MNEEITYQVETEYGEFCASSTDLKDALHYYFVYSQDGPVTLIKVTRLTLQSTEGFKDE